MERRKVGKIPSVDSERSEGRYPLRKLITDAGSSPDVESRVAAFRGNRYRRAYETPEIGSVFGWLTVSGGEYKLGPERRVPVKCRCGSDGSQRVDKLFTGKARMCFTCSQSINGQKGGAPSRLRKFIPDPRLRRRWRAAYLNINKRCTSPSDPNFGNYGARGIENRFESVDEFLSHIITLTGWNAWGMCLDRIDVNGHYEPGNLRVVTPSESARNTRKRIHMGH